MRCWALSVLTQWCPNITPATEYMYLALNIKTGVICSAVKTIVTILSSNLPGKCISCHGCFLKKKSVLLAEARSSENVAHAFPLHCDLDLSGLWCEKFRNKYKQEMQ